MTEEELTKIISLKKGMNRGRKIDNNSVIFSETNLNTINNYWLLGFMEAEGTFGFKNLTPYFQVAQHSKSLPVLIAISTFFKKIFKEKKENLKKEINFNLTINKRTKVYSLTISDIETLYSYILPFFESLSFQSRKGLDFSYWVLGLKLHKFGYFYLSEGRQLILQITKFINKNRYTTNQLGTVKEPKNVKEKINMLNKIQAPFDLSTGLTHIENAKNFTRLIGGRQGFLVHIYENGIEISNSPFFSYSARQKAIGLRANSRVISRKIETGKIFASKYTFYSKPLKIILKT